MRCLKEQYGRLLVCFMLLVFAGVAGAQTAVTAQSKCECCKGNKAKRWSGDYIGMRAVDACNALRDGACKGTDLAKFMCEPYRGAKCCLQSHAGGQLNGTINKKGFCQAKSGEESANFQPGRC